MNQQTRCSSKKDGMEFEASCMEKLISDASLGPNEKHQIFMGTHQNGRRFYSHVILGPVTVAA